jgi:hypothetical protein
MKLVFLSCILFSVCQSLKIDFTTNKIQQLRGQSAVQKFLQNDQLRVIYFYKKGISKFLFLSIKIFKEFDFVFLFC